MSILFMIASCCFVIIAFAQQTVTIRFKNKVGKEDLELGKLYQNPFGEDMVINKFKFYISNITVVDSKGKLTKVSNDYFLIDEADSTSKTIQLSTNIASVQSIEFLLGVDSMHNVSGTQTGSLDPMNGMFWTWNSGYIMAKLEGTSSVAKVPANLFSQHTGGYKMGENAARKIKLTVDNWQLTEKQIIVIEADINKWFQATHNLKISEHPICHSPGILAMQFADNYAAMFSISNTH